MANTETTLTLEESSGPGHSSAKEEQDSQNPELEQTPSNSASLGVSR